MRGRRKRNDAVERHGRENAGMSSERGVRIPPPEDQGFLGQVSRPRVSRVLRRGRKA